VTGTYAAELRHFVKVVTEGIEPRTSLADGIQVLKLLEDGHV